MTVDKTYLVGHRQSLIPAGECTGINIGAMMHHVGTRETAVTSNKISHFHPITTKNIAHPGVSACIQLCVEKFYMDTGQPVVTIRLNLLSPG